jgi:transposase
MAGGGAGTRRTATLAARAAGGRCRAAVGADRAAARDGGAGRRRGTAAWICTCYEAGYEGFWLHRRLVAAGVESVVVDPSSLQVDRRARRKKTDAIDVETILRALVGWDRGERGRCHMVRIPEAAAEDARRCSRERERLIGEQTGHTNRIRGLLMTMGIYDFDPRRRDRRDRLPALVTGDSRALPPGLTIKIGREIERLELVERQIAELERDRTPPRPPGRPRRDTPEPAGSPAPIARLRQLRGVGPTIAAVLYHEVLYRRFANRREVAAYCGLDPTPFASGNLRREQGISKAGNRRARHAAIELAWLWLYWQPDTALARWFRTRLGSATGRFKPIMIVALARKLVIALWRFVDTGLAPDGAILKA